MGRPLCQRRIRFGNRCCRGFSVWRERTRAICVSALPEYPNASNKLLSHVASLAGIGRQLRLLAVGALP